jgi:hypothetical protein
MRWPQQPVVAAYAVVCVVAWGAVAASTSPWLASRGLFADLRLARLLLDVGEVSHTLLELHLSGDSTAACTLPQDAVSIATAARMRLQFPDIAFQRFCAAVSPTDDPTVLLTGFTHEFQAVIVWVRVCLTLLRLAVYLSLQSHVHKRCPIRYRDYVVV